MHYTLLRKGAFSEGSCRELVRPLYARANYKKALESQGHFLKNWGTYISPPKSFFQNDSRTASLLSDQKIKVNIVEKIIAIGNIDTINSTHPT